MTCSRFLLLLGGLLRVASGDCPGPDTCPGLATTVDDDDASLLARKPVFSTNISKTQKDAMDIKMLEVHFHPSQMGLAPKPVEKHAAIERLVQTYAEALARHASDDAASWLALWAPEGNVSFYDPVGADALRSTEAMKKQFQENIPPLSSVTVKEIFFTADDNIFCATLAVAVQDGPTLVLLDRFTVNSDMKITKLEVHFHPSELGIGSKPVEKHAAIEKFVQTYAEALARHTSDGAASWLALWTTSGDVAWYDPVGAPVLDSLDKMKAQLGGIPPLSSVTVEKIWFSADDDIFCAKLAVTVQGGPTIELVDRFFMKAS